MRRRARAPTGRISNVVPDKPTYFCFWRFLQYTLHGNPQRQRVCRRGTPVLLQSKRRQLWFFKLTFEQFLPVTLYVGSLRDLWSKSFAQARGKAAGPIGSKNRRIVL